MEFYHHYYSNMCSMFNGASTFNCDLSQWNTAAVTDMSSMFLYASAFNGDLSQWNTAAVKPHHSMAT